VRSGHPWIFSESLREQSREGAAGELAVIFDRKNEFLAVGLYDPLSPIRVRVLHRGKPVTIGRTWWRERLTAALAKRASLFDTQTNAGRWVNGESDGFPALVLDRYADTLVLKLYSGIWFSRLPEISSLIQDALNPERIVLRFSRNIQADAGRQGWIDGQMIIGSEPGSPIQFRETGLYFEADVVKGQKTGFFLDQRENRRIVETLARGKDVLNAFSFSGGFSLYAARGGAKSVTDLDISAHALESSKRNFVLNESTVRQSQHHLIQTDVFEWLRNPPSALFDLVVLDPPSLAKRQAERERALKAYANLAESGIRLAGAKGIVLCCSCSAHVRADEFFQTVTAAAERGKRKFQVIQTTCEPIDHRAAFAEAEYLKAIYLQLS
jgi:23S rRNA (cytosine1962-C5)-methyltransferase